MRPYLGWRKGRFWCLYVAAGTVLYVGGCYLFEDRATWERALHMRLFYSCFGMILVLGAGVAYWRERKAKARWENAQAKQNGPPE